MEKFIIILLILTLIVTLLRIRIVIFKDKTNTLKLKVYILPKLGINIKLDKFIKRYKDLQPNKIGKLIQSDLTMFIENRKILFDFLKIVRIRKISLVIYYDYLKYPSSWGYLLMWNILASIKCFLDKQTRCINKEEYLVDICQKKNDLDIFVDMIFPLVFLLFVTLKNIKLIIKGILKYGTSNKRAVETIS